MTDRIELSGRAAADVAEAAAAAGFPDGAAYLVDLVRRDREGRDTLVSLLREAEAEGGEHSFDAIMAEIIERRKSRAAYALRA